MKPSYAVALALVFFLLTSPVLAQEKAEEIQPHSPQLVFDDHFYDFGKVEMGTVVRHDYHFRNTGDQPLVIHAAKGGCTCVTAELHSDTLEPDSSSWVTLVFDTKNRVGKEANSILLMANTPQKVHRVRFKGEILWPQKNPQPPN